MKVPEKFVPDVASSQQSASAKRKREGEDVENDASDLEDEDEDSETVEEEEAPAARKKAPRKPVAKKAKVNGTASDHRAPAVTLPSRLKVKAKKVAIADRNAEGLYGTRVWSWRYRNTLMIHS